MPSYKYTTTTSTDHLSKLGREGWELVNGVPTHDHTGWSTGHVFYLRKEMTAEEIKGHDEYEERRRASRHIVTTLLLMITLGFTACTDRSVRPAGEIPGYHIAGLANWLKSGFPLDTSMRFYQYPDAPVPMQQGIIDCYNRGTCQPMTYSIYVPDSIYNRYVRP